MKPSKVSITENEFHVTNHEHVNHINDLSTIGIDVDPGERPTPIRGLFLFFPTIVLKVWCIS